MKIQLLFFGITSDVTEKRSEELTISEGMNIGELKEKLVINYPKLKQHQSFSIAINMEYGEDNMIIKNNDIIALIPPVSGG